MKRKSSSPKKKKTKKKVQKKKRDTVKVPRAFLESIVDSNTLPPQLIELREQFLKGVLDALTHAITKQFHRRQYEK